MSKAIDAILLFSGGLDSILAARLLEEQGLSVLCVHFTTPFFGSAFKTRFWQGAYGLNVRPIDLGESFVEMLRAPAHGVGKTLNPCVDCKILQLVAAKAIMAETGAKFLATGEVIGQRPMSQRRDSLHAIQNHAGVAGLVLRPLCALHLEETEAEKSGLVDRSRLLAISGRSRNAQLELAARFGLRQIPSPGGGCRLTERENARRYWQVLALRQGDTPILAKDMEFANLGRQFWREKDGVWHWLAVGRNGADNEKLLRAAGAADIVIRLAHGPGPVAIARDGLHWPRDLVAEAASVASAHAPRATAEQIHVRILGKTGSGEFAVRPDKHSDKWKLPGWEETRLQIRKAFNGAK